MKTKKILFCVIFALICLVFMMPEVFAGEQELKSLDFDITAKDNGDVTIVETWDIEVYDTNTLFKTFIYDAEYSFKDVSVVDLTNGDGVQMKDVGQYMYHVTPGGYYALDNTSGDFEIAWSADCEGVTRDKKYKITYTVANLVDVYNDCAALYWKLIGYDFEIPAENITGTIHLPHAINNEEEIRVWAHGPLTGEIHKQDSQTVTFSLPDLRTSEYLEIRVVTPPGVFENSNNKFFSNQLNSIIEEETKWAEEANALREKAIEMMKKAGYASIIVSAIIAFFSIRSVSKTKQASMDTPDAKVQKLDYFRDFPAKNVSPGEAEFMREMTSYNTQNVFSAIMMDLAEKKIISFEPIADEKKNVTMVINPFDDEMDIPEDERSILDFVNRASGNIGKITMKDFRKYCEKHDTATYNIWTKLKEKAQAQCRKRGSFSDEIRKKGTKFSEAGAGCFALAIIEFFAAIWVSTAVSEFVPEAAPIMCMAIILQIYAGIKKSKLANKFCGYTEQGFEEHERWKGLKKYMEDFSLLNEKEIPDLALWEKFLVYATAFGIADKVLKQLKVAYPQLADEEYMRTHYAPMYYMDRYDVGRSFGSAASRGYSSYASSQMSSGSGGGGGFSGGGGGGHGGGGGGGR